jgi:CRISPR-associated endonuclease Cas2
MATTTPRQGDFPYVFAYDITDNDRRKDVLKCLKRWRVDGQYSVHETWLRAYQVRELSVELLQLIDRKADSLLVCRLSQRKSSPVYQMCVNPNPSQHKSLMGRALPLPVPAQLSTGDYLICYDIRENKRLQRIQRLMAKRTLYLQRSVYLYRGDGSPLIALLEIIKKEMKDDDDLRIYNLSHIRDMWFLSDEKPIVPETRFSQFKKRDLSWWQRFLSWMRVR